MAEMSVCVSTVSFAVTENMEQQKRKQKPFEFVEMRDLEQKREEKSLRRIIHFSSGETIEEYSTEEDEDEEEEKGGGDGGRRVEKKELLSSGGASSLSWGPYVTFHMWRAATSTVSACDYVGERMASLFGINTAKYQYAIDEHNRKKKEKEDQVGDVQVSEEAESHFDEKPKAEPSVCRESD